MHETIITCVTRNLVGFALITIWPHFSVFVADHTLVANSSYCSRPSNDGINTTWISHLDGV